MPNCKTLNKNNNNSSPCAGPVAFQARVRALGVDAELAGLAGASELGALIDIVAAVLVARLPAGETFLAAHGAWARACVLARDEAG